MFDELFDAWELLPAGQAEALAEARLGAHWAAQAVAAAGTALAEARSDDSHTSMGWDEATRCFIGQPLCNGLRVALDVVALKLLVLREDGSIVEEQALEGVALERAFLWLSKTLHDHGANPGATPLERPHYEMPEHPAADGAPFAPAGLEARIALATWYANAARLESALARGSLGASPVRCWPHHFDLATLVSLDPPGCAAETARSIGVGMSPGDGSYDEPYFYCNPWPVPADPGLGDLAGAGHWHRDGWHGAVLPASKLVATGPREQAEQVYQFLQSAMAANRTLLGAL